MEPIALNLAPVLAVRIDREPACDGERPRQDVCAGDVRLARAMHLQEGLLHEILGASALACLPREEGEELRGDQIVELRERAIVTEGVPVHRAACGVRKARVEARRGLFPPFSTSCVTPRHGEHGRRRGKFREKSCAGESLRGRRKRRIEGRLAVARDVREIDDVALPPDRSCGGFVARADIE